MTFAGVSDGQGSSWSSASANEGERVVFDPELSQWIPMISAKPKQGLWLPVFALTKPDLAKTLGEGGAAKVSKLSARMPDGLQVMF